MTAATTTLLIDAGNSRLKWALCDDGQLKKGDPVTYRWAELDDQLMDAWQSFSRNNPVPRKIILANVAGQRVFDALERALDVKEANEVTIETVVAQASAYGVKNAYKQPEKLGADRWAALVAARHHEDGNVCVIDCGTALTVDILAADGEHMGGIIAPGWEMMESSLVANTQGIDSSEGKIPELLGQTTQQAVQAGISAACAGAVEYIVRRFMDEGHQGVKGSALKCVVTGGAASLILPQLVSSKLDGVFQHEPDWVFKGLAVISGHPVDDALASTSGEVL